MSERATNIPRSLIERAAAIYDFDAAARARRPVMDAADLTPRPEPVAEPVTADGPAPVDYVRVTVDRDVLAAGGFIAPEADTTALTEEFRLVKRQLLHAAAEGDGAARERMILVASALPGEGKTFCALNLALSIAAEKDHEVLLVDADVAKPSILAALGIVMETARPAGLVDAIADPAIDAEACILRTDIANLSVLPAGRAGADTTELLASDRTRMILEALADRSKRRILIFDSPPALAASPASELAHLVGRVLLVVRADRTGETELREAAGLLAGCDDIRLLLNATTLKAGGRRFGSYYGHEF